MSIYREPRAAAPRVATPKPEFPNEETVKAIVSTLNTGAPIGVLVNFDQLWPWSKRVMVVHLATRKSTVNVRFYLRDMSDRSAVVARIEVAIRELRQIPEPQVDADWEAVAKKAKP